MSLIWNPEMVFSTGRHLPDSNFESSMLNLGRVPNFTSRCGILNSEVTISSTI